MGHYEDIKIDRSEGWKYSNTHGTSGDDYHARVYVDDDGNISHDSYSRKYIREKNKEELGKNSDKEGKGEKGNDKSGNSGEKKEGCLTKIIKAPFRFLWWLIKFILKNALVILTFGIANGWFDKKDD
jgi:hypothetical protein